MVANGRMHSTWKRVGGYAYWRHRVVIERVCACVLQQCEHAFHGFRLGGVFVQEVCTSTQARFVRAAMGSAMLQVVWWQPPDGDCCSCVKFLRELNWWRFVLLYSCCSLVAIVRGCFGVAVCLCEPESGIKSSCMHLCSSVRAVEYVIR